MLYAVFLISWIFKPEIVDFVELFQYKKSIVINIPAIDISPVTISATIIPPPKEANKKKPIFIVCGIQYNIRITISKMQITLICRQNL